MSRPSRDVLGALGRPRPGPTPLRPLDQSQRNYKKKITGHGGGPVRGSLIGDLATREQLEVGDQLAHGSAGGTGVAMQLALQPQPPPVPQRTPLGLELRAPHPAAAP